MRVQVLGFGVESSGVGVSGFGFQGLWVRALGVWGWRSRVEDLGFWVLGFGVWGAGREGERERERVCVCEREGGRERGLGGWDAGRSAAPHQSNFQTLKLQPCAPNSEPPILNSKP